jgi:release factor glutamine methyltransferase
MKLIDLTHAIKHWFAENTCAKRFSDQTLWHRARTVIGHHYGLTPLDWVTHLHATHHQELSFSVDDFAWLLNHAPLATAPLSRLLGCAEFCGHVFSLNADTLDPRWETEGLVQGMHERLCHSPSVSGSLRMLDVGTGSGCILISLLKLWPGAVGWGLDIAPHALQAACHNAQGLDVASRSQWLHSDGLSVIDSWDKTPTFDVIVSNPPYIDPADHLDEDVLCWDPPTALFAPNHGLALYQTWIPKMWEYLAPGGWLGLEINCQHVNALGGVMSPFSWTWEISVDTAGQQRYLWAFKPHDHGIVKAIPS